MRCKQEKKVLIYDEHNESSYIELTHIEVHLYFVTYCSLLHFLFTGTGEGTLVSPVGPDELPPPYTPSSSGVPMVTCRVCQAMIDISGKVDQHVVKCNQCNEATVSVNCFYTSLAKDSCFERCFMPLSCVNGIIWAFMLMIQYPCYFVQALWAKFCLLYYFIITAFSATTTVLWIAYVGYSYKHYATAIAFVDSTKYLCCLWPSVCNIWYFCYMKVSQSFVLLSRYAVLGSDGQGKKPPFVFI